MTKTSFDIDWEIQQLSLAIDYYERALNHIGYSNQSKKYLNTIKELSNKIKELEKERDKHERREHV